MKNPFRKQRSKASLPAPIDHEKRELELQNLRLVTIIRNMDQEIFRMGQCTDWPQQRPIFAALLEQTNLRMNDESNRIRRLLVPEIQKAYNTERTMLSHSPFPSKQIEHK